MWCLSFKWRKQISNETGGKHVRSYRSGWSKTSLRNGSCGFDTYYNASDVVLVAWLVSSHLGVSPSIVSERKKGGVKEQETPNCTCFLNVADMTLTWLHWLHSYSERRRRGWSEWRNSITRIFCLKTLQSSGWEKKTRTTSECPSYSHTSVPTTLTTSIITTTTTTTNCYSTQLLLNVLKTAC